MHDIQLALRRTIEKTGWLTSLAYASIWMVFLYPFFFLLANILPFYGIFATFLSQVTSVLVWVFIFSLIALFAYKRYQPMAWALGLQALLQLISLCLAARYFLSLGSLCMLLIYGGLLFCLFRYTGAARAIGAIFGVSPSRPAPDAKHPLYRSCPWCGIVMEKGEALCGRCHRPVTDERKGMPVCAECGAKMHPGQYLCTMCGTASAEVPFRPRRSAPAAQPMQTPRRCNVCGMYAAAPDSSYCMNCGAPLPAAAASAYGTVSAAPAAPQARVCPSCGTQQQNDTLPFCTRCGANLAAQPVHAPTPADTFEYVPPVIPKPDQTIAMHPSEAKVPAQDAAIDASPAAAYTPDLERTIPLQPLAVNIVEAPVNADETPVDLSPAAPSESGAAPVSAARPATESTVNPQVQQAAAAAFSITTSAPAMPTEGSSSGQEEIAADVFQKQEASAAPAMRFCTCCGEPAVSPTAKFCMRCGNLL